MPTGMAAARQALDSSSAGVFFVRVFDRGRQDQHQERQ